ncbi:hypothetical protein CES86_0216 [Brucella lupini]|uniref:Uncharacterized protein n=1 Tax=Brucella lupini TaxID=255457 RepID=A0A256GYM1_9HYPH|nr:hypothetical protein CES86_0216 [Brucella lupini]
MNMPLFSLSFLAVHFENRQTILIVHPKPFIAFMASFER